MRHNVFASKAAWAPRFHERVKEVVNDDIMEKLLAKYMVRLADDLNRIATGRLAERSIDRPLTFTVTRGGPKVLFIKPSDPVLFKALEFGEFNDDGTLKTPPHSVLAEWKAIIRL